MKTKLNILLCLAFAWACSQSEKTEITEGLGDSRRKDIAEYALSLDSARKYIWRYDSIMFTIFHRPNPVRAFTIRAEDLLQAFGAPLKDTSIMKFRHARLYLGIDHNNRFRAFITPVMNANMDKHFAGRDTVLSGPYKHRWMNVRSSEAVTNEGDYVFDFTMPCPNSCDTESKLFDYYQSTAKKD